MLFLQYLWDILFLVAYVGAGKSFPNPLSREEEALCIQKMTQGDEEARDRLIEHNLRLVAHIAKKYLRQGRDADDIISIGTIGLIKAVSTFQPDKGASLSAYASRCIENEILMSIRLERKQVLELSLSNPIGTDGDGNDISFADVLGTDPDIVVDEVQRRFDGRMLTDLIDRVLTRREAIVARFRYGIGCERALTQREVAAMLGISRSYVSRIEKKALSKLHSELSKRME